jgi:subtilase family serine protease
VAPAARIEVILADSTADSNPVSKVDSVVAAVRLAATRAAVLSISSSNGESCFTPTEVESLNVALKVAQEDRLTVVASSGDYGPVSEPCPGAGSSATPVQEIGLPSSDPLVLAVGGTRLVAASPSGRYRDETVWNTPPLASGGGFSRLFARPGYQDGVRGIGGMRGVPDVAADADGITGLAVVLGYGQGGYTVEGASGTSAGAPFWGALIALADQEAGRDLGFVNPTIYKVGRSAEYHRAFHEISSGTNTTVITTGGIATTYTGYQAVRGWNPATGWGSPVASALVPLLAHS